MMVGKTLDAHKVFLVIIHGTHANPHVQRQGAGHLVIMMEMVVAVADIRGRRDVQQPLGVQHPVVTVAEKQAIVIVEDAGGGILRRELFVNLIRKLLYIKTHVKMLQTEACQP